MSDNDCADWEKRANDLDMSILFIHGCNSDDMWNNLECMNAFSQDKYPQNIELACKIFHTK